MRASRDRPIPQSRPNNAQTGILAGQTGLSVVLNDQSRPKLDDKKEALKFLAMRLNHHLNKLSLNLFNNY